MRLTPAVASRLVAAVLWLAPLGVVPVAAATAAPPPPLYVVRDLEGDVSTWQRFGAGWRPVAVGDRLPFAAMIRSQAAATITAQPEGEAEGRKLLIMTLPAAMVTRLSPDAVKKPRFRGYTLTSESMFAGFQKEEPVVRSLSAAWERVMTLFDSSTAKRSERTEEFLAARPIGGDGKVGFRPEITLRQPPDGTTFVLDEIPKTIPVHWLPLGDGRAGPWRVFFWAPADGPARLAGSTDESYFRVSVARPGQYYVRVESRTGAHRSRAHLIVVTGLATSPLSR